MERKLFESMMTWMVVAWLIAPASVFAADDSASDPAAIAPPVVQEEDLQREHPPQDLDKVRDFKVADTVRSTDDQLDAMRSTLERLKREASPEAVAKLQASVKRLKHTLRHQQHTVAAMHADLNRLHEALNRVHDPAVQHALASTTPTAGAPTEPHKVDHPRSEIAAAQVQPKPNTTPPHHPATPNAATTKASKAPLVLADDTPVTPPLPAQVATKPSADGDTMGPPVPNATTEAELWKQVTLGLSSKAYGDAQQRLKAYLKRYPHGPKVADAYFWLGDLAMMERRYQVAQAYFVTVVREAPLHPRSPDALLKLARLEDRLGRPAAALAYARRCIEEYPKSTAAHVAKVLEERWVHRSAPPTSETTSARAQPKQGASAHAAAISQFAGTNPPSRVAAARWCR